MGKSQTITRRKKKSKTPSREELAKRYTTMIKSNYKNVLNELKVHKKTLTKSKRGSKSGIWKTPKKKSEPRVSIEKYEMISKELEELKIKYGQLEEKYADTHNDLLRSNNSVKVEALRFKKKSERSLKDSLKIINKNNNIKKSDQNNDTDEINNLII